jgi:hypothetical protein
VLRLDDSIAARPDALVRFDFARRRACQRRRRVEAVVEACLAVKVVAVAGLTTDRDVIAAAQRQTDFQVAKASLHSGHAFGAVGEAHAARPLSRLDAEMMNVITDITAWTRAFVFRSHFALQRAALHACCERHCEHQSPHHTDIIALR